MAMDLAFALVNDVAYPDPQKVIATGKRLGLELRHEPGTGVETEPMSFAFGTGGTFMVMLLPAPHPDAAKMPVGPTSPPREHVATTKAHFILTAMGLEGEPRKRDAHMARLVATVIENVSAVGAMLGHGVLFHRADVFAGMAAASMDDGELPSEVAVDITTAGEPNDRMSFLSHGMQRYGREEIYVTCSVAGKGALDFVFMLTRWMLADREKHFGTGETIGRTMKEKLTIQRVPNPTGQGPLVIRLDLP